MIEIISNSQAEKIIKWLVDQDLIDDNDLRRLMTTMKKVEKTAKKERAYMRSIRYM